MHLVWKVDVIFTLSSVGSTCKSRKNELLVFNYSSYAFILAPGVTKKIMIMVYTSLIMKRGISMVQSMMTSAMMMDSIEFLLIRIILPQKV